MYEAFTKKNIVEKQVALLLNEDRKAVDAVIEILKKQGNYDPKVLVNHGINRSAATLSDVLALKEKMNIRNDCLLQYAGRILNAVIIEAETKPWQMPVNALSNYVDWLYTHSIDVAVISLMIAAKLGYSDEELWNLGLGAFLHDVGKLMIPKNIIQKPGSLNEMEMEYIRRHCELGASLLEPFHIPQECTDIVLQHHERLDGSGYPKGLRKDEICRNARIVMIADAVDAITSSRPYKRPKEMDAAIRILRSEGEKYSQELISLLEKILK